MFSLLHTGVRIPTEAIEYIIDNLCLYKVILSNLFYADWCNSNITGSCPVNIGANPLSAL